MSAQSTFNSEFLIRQNVYSNDLLPPLEPLLLNDVVVYDVTGDFSDGDTFYVPKMGMPAIRQRTEDEPSRIDNVPGTRFQMSITEFPETAVGITRKNAEDSYIMAKFVSQLVPAQQNALMQRYETVLMNVQSGQTAADPNLFDGVPHRLIAGGASQTITTADFRIAAYALDTANVPTRSRVAIISPGMAMSLKAEISNVNIAFNRDFLGLPAESVRDGLDVTFEIEGFRVFVSNFVAEVSETISGEAITDARVALFMSIADDYCKPIARGWRRQPTAQVYIDEPRDNMEVYRVNGRFGVGLIRPEGLVTVLAKDPAI